MPVVGVAALVLTVFLGRTDCPLQEPEETRYAEIARQMAAQDAWLVPTYHARPYPDKPPLVYWLTRCVYSVLGANERAVHVTAGLCGLATVLGVFWWACVVGGGRVGWIAAMLLSLMPRYVYLARQLTPDTLLTACVVIAWAALAAARNDGGWRRGPWYVASIACALGCLAKGPVAVVLVIGPSLLAFLPPPLWGRAGVGGKHSSGAEPQPPTLTLPHKGGGNQRRTGRMTIFIGVSIFLAIAAPWFIVIAWTNPEFATEFFWKHNVERFTTAFDHVQPAWYYLPGLALGLMPWGLVFWRAGSVSDRRSDSAKASGLLRSLTLPARQNIALIAALFCLAFFSASACKRPAYILPVYPAMAVALAVPLAARLRDTSWRWTVGSMVVAVVAGVLMTLPPYADRQSLREPCRALAAEVAAGTPVVCYPRPCDGAAFYLGLDHLTSYAEEHRDILVQELASRPATILFARSGRSLEELLNALPPGLRFTAMDQRAGTTVGRVESFPLQR
jgi:4-amino-4-deoxy-L-arabinose transferase-like glycosyltransferase